MGEQLCRKEEISEFSCISKQKCLYKTVSTSNSRDYSIQQIIFSKIDISFYMLSADSYSKIKEESRILHWLDMLI